MFAIAGLPRIRSPALHILSSLILSLSQKKNENIQVPGSSIKYNKYFDATHFPLK